MDKKLILPTSVAECKQADGRNTGLFPILNNPCLTSFLPAPADLLVYTWSQRADLLGQQLCTAAMPL